ncbi:hypothetical protein Dform_01809 [Dehalogenimonas formicexedens]|uniref:Uncharacterized protein n=1 Tax=Dehalogenimonas formicexedens TaxID=1839801 RepID=A0A1P8F9L0_9CHLR|nr:hypothetical protein [Dehalogenimonas formicexedens]APV45128.1 hypothetical protein Dform_01809 [Dehalogenimonas formicexedens]
MRIFNNYVLSVSTALLATVVILAGFGQQSLDVYYTLFIIEALIITELYVYLNNKARRALNLVSVLLFAGFLVIVLQKVAAILI